MQLVDNAQQTCLYIFQYTLLLHILLCKAYTNFLLMACSNIICSDMYNMFYVSTLSC